MRRLRCPWRGGSRFIVVYLCWVVLGVYFWCLVLVAFGFGRGFVISLVCGFGDVFFFCGCL